MEICAFSAIAVLLASRLTQHSIEDCVIANLEPAENVIIAVISCVSVVIIRTRHTDALITTMRVISGHDNAII